jgi:hypothetical protein
VNTKGEIIDQAYTIVKKTFQQINRIKDDLDYLLIEAYPSIRYIEQYSYGSNALFLKPNHSYLFGQLGDISDDGKLDVQTLLVMCCIFYDSDGINKISLKDQPEIWFLLVDVRNCKKCRVWDISSLLRVENRGGFRSELSIGSKVIEYYWANQENDEEWKAKCVGYPLVEITDINVLKSKVLDRLWESHNSL